MAPAFSHQVTGFGIQHNNGAHLATDRPCPKARCDVNSFESAFQVSAPTRTISSTVKPTDVEAMMDRYQYTPETRDIIRNEKLLPAGMLSRVQAQYPQHSGLLENTPFMFDERAKYSGLRGFRDVVAVLEKNGIDIGFIQERELFIEIYRFLATRHVLNAINWQEFATDSLFQLVFPQPGMLAPGLVQSYISSPGEAERKAIVDDYITEHTNPHDGNQLLNKPWFENETGELEFVEGSQHKYPQCQLIFDKTTQNCFAFCTYCFRHAQVRGDEDMFLQKDILQVHNYLRQHTEITDMLITGGDGGYIPVNRLEQYMLPVTEDPSLLHIRTVRLASRALSYSPEMILSPKYDAMLALFQKLVDNGIQVAWMAHFSTPREFLNPSTIAAIRRLQAHGVTIRSQSPIMKHISLFLDDDGNVDVDRSAQNWIDLGNLMATMQISFHSMYCARPTGEHHYFTASLADIDKVASKIHRSLASINRPSRYISMTSSAGKISLLGTTTVGGEKAFALKFTEGRNMEWMDKVFLAKYDEEENTVDLLQPFDTPDFFFRDEQQEIEGALKDALLQRMNK